MVKLATFDVLDKELTRDSAAFLGVDDENRWANTQTSFQLDPTYWKDYYAKIKPHLAKFNWQEFKFSTYTDLNKLITTKDVGIYLFIVRPDDLIITHPQHVMYVGISGEGGSNRPLRDRLSDYFNISNIKKRSKLHRMLKKYYKQTWVVFTLINKMTPQDLEQLEEDFHGFFVPPAADRDFPVKMKKIIKAQFTR